MSTSVSASSGAAAGGCQTAARRKSGAMTLTQYTEKVNAKFSKLKIQQAPYVSQRQFNSAAKTNVLIEEALMQAAADDPEFAALLEQRLREMPAAEKALFDKLEESGRELTGIGFAIDGKGVLRVIGRGKSVTGQESGFDLRLTVIGKDGSAGLTDLMMRQFDRDAFKINMTI